MRNQTVSKLLKINAQFYQSHWQSFNNTRKNPWQGWKELYQRDYFKHANHIRVLDVGCGNGRFLSYLNEIFPQDQLEFVGIDQNSQLLQEAKKNFPQGEFFQADLVDGFPEEITKSSFDIVVAYGVFHHLPSFYLKTKVLDILKQYIKTNGLIIISLWQFAEHERFQKQILSDQEIKQVGIDPNDLDANDYLLPWQGDRENVRYCHHYSADEIDRLLDEQQLALVDSFYADGKTNNLNKYLVLSKSK